MTLIRSARGKVAADLRRQVPAVTSMTPTSTVSLHWATATYVDRPSNDLTTDGDGVDDIHRLAMLVGCPAVWSAALRYRDDRCDRTTPNSSAQANERSSRASQCRRLQQATRRLVWLSTSETYDVCVCSEPGAALWRHVIVELHVGMHFLSRQRNFRSSECVCVYFSHARRCTTVITPPRLQQMGGYCFWPRRMRVLPRFVVLSVGLSAKMVRCTSSQTVQSW